MRAKGRLVGDVFMSKLESLADLRADVPCQRFIEPTRNEPSPILRRRARERSLEALHFFATAAGSDGIAAENAKGTK
jgi:hypothetical protein